MTLRIALLRDFPEEHWPSMDLCADMLVQHWRSDTSDVTVDDLCPRYRRRFGLAPVVGRKRIAKNADRYLNRYRGYPRFVRGLDRKYDIYHVVDHSYAHLVLDVPAGRAGVYCHDVEAFRCLFDPAADPRRAWYRKTMERVLAGLRRAAVVFYSTDVVRREIVAHRLVDEARLVQAPLGVAAEFHERNDSTPTPVPPGPAYLLHVGSCIPRKRIDVLLDVFARAALGRSLRLVQVGGQWTAAQSRQIERLGIADRVVQIHGLDRKQLAAVYRGAAVVLMPSDAEGFGIPIIEALASGAFVVASDLPVLREVGGEAALYASVGDIPAWSAMVAQILDAPQSAPPLERRLAWSARYTWSAHAAVILAAYRRLASG